MLGGRGTLTTNRPITAGAYVSVKNRVAFQLVISATAPLKHGKCWLKITTQRVPRGRQGPSLCAMCQSRCTHQVAPQLNKARQREEALHGKTGEAGWAGRSSLNSGASIYCLFQHHVREQRLWSTATSSARCQGSMSKVCFWPLCCQYRQ